MSAVVHQIISLRASSMARALLCPGSARGELRIDRTDEAGRLGTAAHKLLRKHVDTGAEPYEDVPALAAEYDVREDDLAFLLRKGIWCWRKLKPALALVHTEIALRATILGIELTGHADVVISGSRIVRGYDWKSGRKDTDYSAQMRTYCALILLSYPEADEVEFSLVWLRTEEVEVYRMNRQQLEEFVEELRGVVEWDGVYHPGDHCHYCPRSHECQAAHALARRDILAIADQDLVARVESELSRMPAESIVQLLLKADRVEKCAKRVKDAIKGHVDDAGRVEGDTLALELETTEAREVKPLEAWPVLEAVLTNEELAACMRLSVTGLEKQVATKAGKGAGAKAVRKLREELEAAHAFQTKERHALVAKRR